jgi:3-mercaptopyruvate sulfurtransferase SseA
MNRGIARVRPLEGGYDEWKRLGYPLEKAIVDEPERLTS